MNMKGYRLLIVDDEEINRFVIDKLLRTTGCRFTFAGSGEEALVMIQNGTYDIVLLDIELPGMNGYETASTIRQMAEKIENWPIIVAMTGHQHPEEPGKMISCGINGWVVKPFKLEDLNDVIRESAEQSKSSGKNKVPTVNLAILESIAGDDPAFIRLCIGLFLKEMPENLSRLQNAIANCDWETIRTTSHKMKTSLNYMGLGEQRIAAMNIEKLARDKRDMPRIISETDQIKSVCQIAFEELKEIIHDQETEKP